MKSASQMKLNPSLPTKSDFNTQVISSTVGGFIPDERTDLVKKKHHLSGRQMVFLFSERVTKRSRIEVKVSKSSVTALFDKLELVKLYRNKASSISSSSAFPVSLKP